MHDEMYHHTILRKGYFFALAFIVLWSILTTQNVFSQSPTNLISNADFETVSPTSSTMPAGWIRGRWGTNTTTFSYPISGPDGSKAAEVTMSARTTGDAKWAFAAVTVTPGRTYTYSDTYNATVSTFVTLEFTKTDGTVSYLDVALPPATSGWTSENIPFTVPNNVHKVTVFHLINQVGKLQIDNVSLIDTTPPSNLPSNIVPNPSLESSNAQGLPVNWLKGRWGTNTTMFSFPVPPHTGANAAQVDITSYTSGDAKWYFAEVPTGGNRWFEFSDYFKSTTQGFVTVQFRDGSGNLTYTDIGTTPIASGWTQFKAPITVPVGTVSFTVFHLIKSVGTLTTDDYRVIPLASDPTKFDKGYVSLNFDDNYLSAYNNALPILDAAGFKTDQFIITDYMKNNFPGYANTAQVLDMQTRGHAIQAHTRTHPNLTASSTSEATAEIVGSRQDLLNVGISPVHFFAYPYGAYNSQVQQMVKNAGFLAARSSDGGYNDKKTDLYALQRRPMGNTTTFAEVKNYIDTAMTNKTWLILLFHEVDINNNQYAITPALFQQIVDYLKQKNITPILLEQGVQMMTQ